MGERHLPQTASLRAGTRPPVEPPSWCHHRPECADGDRQANEAKVQTGPSSWATATLGVGYTPPRPGSWRCRPSSLLLDARFRAAASSWRVVSVLGGAQDSSQQSWVGPHLQYSRAVVADRRPPAIVDELVHAQRALGADVRQTRDALVGPERTERIGSPGQACSQTVRSACWPLYKSRAGHVPASCARRLPPQCMR